jgi:hypothetical protein
MQTEGLPARLLRRKKNVLNPNCNINYQLRAGMVATGVIDIYSNVLAY